MRMTTKSCHRRASRSIRGTNRDLECWIKQGAPWPDGIVLAPRPKTALPDWNAPAGSGDRCHRGIPKNVTLETAADFHQLLVVARFKDAATQDITRQVEGDPRRSLARATRRHPLKPLKDGTTTLTIEYRGLKTEVPWW